MTHLKYILANTCPDCHSKAQLSLDVTGQMVTCSKCSASYWVGTFYAIERTKADGEYNQRGFDATVDTTDPIGFRDPMAVRNALDVFYMQRGR
jgi:hypothetical protein